ncbi:MAG: twin-arginine translocase TatA/TatE family subunit [Coriobacteriia bacterium]|nr:twin-arginine translocase TatA/TatE family subunit [Coriobacteriia bacterium]
MEGFLGIGGNELIIILIFAFLIFGPDKLPDIARTIGRAIAKFRDAQAEVNEVIKREVVDPVAEAAAEDKIQQVADKAASLNKPEQPKTETFAERKARYDKIRAERKAKEEAAKAAAEANGAAGSVPKAPAEPTTDDLDALLGVSKPAPAAQPAAAEDAKGGDA